MAEKNTITLITPTFHSITRSFSRKVQIKQFEPIDFFASHNEAIPMEEATPEKISEVSERLYQICLAEVEVSIKGYQDDMARANGVTPAVSAKELKAIAKFVADINSADSQVAIDSVKEAIKQVKDTLNETQLEFLRVLVRKAEARI